MRASMTKLAAVAAMALGLGFGGGTAAGATPVSLPHWEGLDEGNGRGNARRTLVRLETAADGEQRAGYMVGRYFVGFELPE